MDHGSMSLIEQAWGALIPGAELIEIIRAGSVAVGLSSVRCLGQSVTDGHKDARCLPPDHRLHTIVIGNAQILDDVDHSETAVNGPDRPCRIGIRCRTNLAWRGTLEQ